MGVTVALIQALGAIPLLGILLVLLGVYYISSNYQAPLGPKPLPLVGNLLQINMKRPHETLMELSKRFGSVFTVHFGIKKVVVISGFRAVKEALRTFDEAFGQRDVPAMVGESTRGHGVLFSNGESWRDMRRFTLTKMRDFGMGKQACEDKIVEECNHLIELLQQLQGEAFNTSDSITCSISNIICSIVYGSRFKYGDPEFRAQVSRADQMNHLQLSLSLQLYNLFPLLFHWVPNRQKMLSIVAENRKQTQTFLARLKETLNPDACRGFVDAFLVQQQNMEDSGTKSHFHDDNLLQTVLDLFIAGTETTATTLRWALLLVAKHPDIQDRVQEELRSVLEGRQVKLEDRRTLPYTNAVIHEVQRLSAIIPMSLPHKTSRDVTFRGQFIQKGTTVYPLLISVLYDESEWERPHNFHPPHFLDKDGKFIKREAFLPFSAGQRVCLGESLAKMELFIFFSTLLQHFRFTPPPGLSEEDLDVTPHVCFTLLPPPHTLCAVAQ